MLFLIAFLCDNQHNHSNHDSGDNANHDVDKDDSLCDTAGTLDIIFHSIFKCRCAVISIYLEIRQMLRRFVITGIESECILTYLCYRFRNGNSENALSLIFFTAAGMVILFS